MRRYAYPIFLDLHGRLVVIVGGGAAGARKARGALEGGAGRVRVVARSFSPEMPEGIERVEKAFEPGQLHGADLVIAATDDPRVNEEVVREARRLGTAATRTDGAGGDHGDFTVPAIWRNGALSVAISTGCAPALSALIRDGIGEWMDPRWIAMADAMVAVRPIVSAAGVPPERRREIYRSLITTDALEAAGQEGTDGVLNWLASRYPDLGLPPAAARQKEEM